MSVNTIQTAAVIQSELDKAAVEQATSGWMEVNSNLVKYNGGSEVKIPELSMDGLADYDRQNGFVAGGVNFKYQTKTMTQSEVISAFPKRALMTGWITQMNDLSRMPISKSTSLTFFLLSLTMRP